MAERVEFKRNIGLFMAVMIGIGAMMGPGIFALPSEVSQLVGPLGIVVYLAMGLITMITALNYAELGASIPLAGGGYSFVARVLPKPVSFLTGWFFWIGNVAACAMYAVIFALTIIPIGLLLRLFGKDPLRLKFDAGAKSYWIERDPPGPPPSSMPQQFWRRRRGPRR